MKSFFSKIFVIAAAVTLLTVTMATPAYAIGGQLPGQNEFWERFENQTGIGSGATSSPAVTTPPTPEPTSEMTPGPVPNPELTVEATEPPAAETARAEISAEETAATLAPEASQPATTIVIDNSQTYNDNRVYYYNPEPTVEVPGAEVSAEVLPEGVTAETETTYTKVICGIKVSVDASGHLTNEGKLQLFGVFAAFGVGMLLLAYVGFFEYLKFGFGCLLESIRGWFRGY